MLRRKKISCSRCKRKVYYPFNFFKQTVFERHEIHLCGACVSWCVRTLFYKTHENSDVNNFDYIYILCKQHQ